MRKSYRILKMALNALRRNIMRSALTTLGIVIGVSAVIAMMEIGQGSSSAVQQTIASMGANMLLVQPGTASSGGVTFGSGSILTLTPDDGDAILRECPSVVSELRLISTSVLSASTPAAHSRGFSAFRRAVGTSALRR